jgi:uncharacterized delta-60 repeat protein
MRVLFFLLLLSLVHQNAFSQSGSRDSSFSGNGALVPSLTNSTIQIDGALPLSGNRVLAYGTASDSATGAYCFMVRYTENAAVDPSFGVSGFWKYSLSGSINPSWVIEMHAKLLPDGKIVVVAGSPYPNQKVEAMRLTENGQFDNSFDSDGIVPLDSFFRFVNGIEIEPKNKFVILGKDESDDSWLLRLNANGSVDNTLGGNKGLLIDVDLGFAVNYFDGVKRINANEYLLFGYGHDVTASQYNNFLAKINNQGGLVNAFGTNGRLILDMEAEDAQEYTGDVLLLADGKILVSTFAEDENYEEPFNAYFYVSKFLANGQPDISFSGDGVFVQQPSVDGFATTGTLTVQPDGKILITGAYQEGLESEFSVLRLTAGGVADITWNTTGISRLNITLGLDYGLMALPQTNGRVVVVGIAGTTGLSEALTLARFGTNGVADFTYAQVGVSSTVVGNGQPKSSYAKTICSRQAANGTIYTAGEYSGIDENDFFVTAVSASGALVSSFGNNGTANICVDIYNRIFDMELQPDGKILLAFGSSGFRNLGQLGVLRFNANGTLDVSFGFQGKTSILPADVEANEGLDIVVQPNGKIGVVCSGTNINTQEDESFVVRLLANGRADSTFFGDGYTDLDFIGQRILAQPDNKLVVAGVAYDAQFDEETAVTRFLATTGKDLTFNAGNRTALRVGGENYQVLSLDLTTTNQIAVGTSTSTTATGNFFTAVYTSAGLPNNTINSTGNYEVMVPFTPGFAKFAPNLQMVIAENTEGLYDQTTTKVCKVNPSGNLDYSFATAGIATVAARPNPLQVLVGLGLQADGKILLMGETGSYDYSDAFLIRLNNTLAEVKMYAFNTSGNWNNPANWQGGVVPPNPLPEGSEVIINPTGGNQECMLNVPVTVPSGAFIRVRPGKKFTVNNQLTVPAFIQQ